MRRKKKRVATTRTWLEAVAIKKASDNLNKKLGVRNRALLKRKGVDFEVWI